MSAVLVGLVVGAFVPILRVLIRALRVLDRDHGLLFEFSDETLEHVGKVVSVIYGLIFIGGVVALDRWTVRADGILGPDHRRVPDWFRDGFSLTHSQAGALLISFTVAALLGNRLIERGQRQGGQHTRA